MGNPVGRLLRRWSLQRFVQGASQIVKTEMASTVSNPEFRRVLDTDFKLQVVKMVQMVKTQGLSIS